jgi:hypothetical protein
MNNLHQYNLEVLVNLKANQELKLSTVGEVQNKLVYDDSYMTMIGLRSSDQIEHIIQVYSTSFYHFLNLIQLPNSSSMSSCVNLSQLDHTEFQLKIIDLLENSLKGLFKYENYCRYYNLKKADYISNTIAKLSNDLVNYKSSVMDLHNSVENEKKLFMTDTIRNKNFDIFLTEDTDLGLQIISKKDSHSTYSITLPTESTQPPNITNDIPSTNINEPESVKVESESVKVEPESVKVEPESVKVESEYNEEQHNILMRIKITIIDAFNKVKNWFRRQFNRLRRNP